MRGKACSLRCSSRTIDSKCSSTTAPPPPRWWSLPSAALKAIQTLENAWADDASGADGDARRRPVAAA